MVYYPTGVALVVAIRLSQRCGNWTPVLSVPDKCLGASGGRRRTERNSHHVTGKCGTNLHDRGNHQVSDLSVSESIGGRT
jgi:hypothetical protein